MAYFKKMFKKKYLKMKGLQIEHCSFSGQYSNVCKGNVGGNVLKVFKIHLNFLQNAVNAASYTLHPNFYFIFSYI